MFEGIIYCDIKCIIIFLLKKGIVFIVIELKGENVCINEKNEIIFLYWICRKLLFYNMC